MASGPKNPYLTPGINPYVPNPYGDWGVTSPYEKGGPYGRPDWEAGLEGLAQMFAPQAQGQQRRAGYGLPQPGASSLPPMQIPGQMRPGKVRYELPVLLEALGLDPGLVSRRGG